MGDRPLSRAFDVFLGQNAGSLLPSCIGRAKQGKQGTRLLLKERSTAGRNEEIISIDLKRLIEKGDASLDVPIMDGDSIYISKAGVFYVTGEVKKPDANRRGDNSDQSYYNGRGVFRQGVERPGQDHKKKGREGRGPGKGLDG